MIKKEIEPTQGLIRIPMTMEETESFALDDLAKTGHFIQFREIFGKRKFFFTKCSNCKTFIINGSRGVKYCPVCSEKRDAKKQRIKRAIKQGRRLCEYCREPLPKKYPNRVFCEGGICKQAAYRERERKKVRALCEAATAIARQVPVQNHSQTAGSPGTTNQQE